MGPQSTWHTAQVQTTVVLIRYYMYRGHARVNHIFVVTSVTDMSDISFQIALSYFLPESSKKEEMIKSEICTLEAMARIMDAGDDSQVKVVIGMHHVGRKLLSRLTEWTSKIMEASAIARGLPPAITLDFESCASKSANAEL